MTLQAGDVGFSHSPGIIGKGIRLAEWLRFRKGSKFSHTFTLDRLTEDGDWFVLEAREHGVTAMRRLSTIPTHVIISSAPFCNREEQLNFLRAQVGQRYGYVTIFSVLATLILPKFINVMLPNTWICSAVAAEGLRAGGWVHNWPDLYQVTPAELYEVLTEGEGSETGTVEKG